MSKEIYPELVLMYKIGDLIAVAIKEDSLINLQKGEYKDLDNNPSNIPDFLVIEINKDGIIYNEPHSIQRKTTSAGGYWETLPKNTNEYLESFLSNINNENIKIIIDQLVNPPMSSIYSLISVPPRLMEQVENKRDFASIRVIAFDADDTLWVNETYYQNTEEEFCKLLINYATQKEISKELLRIEIQNMDLYGFGAKAFLLSMIETAILISNNTIENKTIDEVIKLGKALIYKPIELIDNIEIVLSKLKERYKLVLATKGDLLDQKRKLKNSGLSKYFEHVEVMSDKKEDDYKNLLEKINVKPESFLMIGNSVKSDVIPVINIEGKAIHIPFHITWEHEKTSNNSKLKYKTVNNISEIIKYLI